MITFHRQIFHSVWTSMTKMTFSWIPPLPLPPITSYCGTPKALTVPNRTFTSLPARARQRAACKLAAWTQRLRWWIWIWTWPRRVPLWTGISWVSPFRPGKRRTQPANAITFSPRLFDLSSQSLCPWLSLTTAREPSLVRHGESSFVCVFDCFSIICMLDSSSNLRMRVSSSVGCSVGRHAPRRVDAAV